MSKKKINDAIHAASKSTGKCLEDLMEETKTTLAKESPTRYREMLKRLANEEYRRMLARVEQRARKLFPKANGPEMDKVYRSLALSIGEQIRLDNEYEQKWDAIKQNLRAEGAHSDTHSDNVERNKR